MPAFDVTRFENDHAVIWVSSEYLIAFFLSVQAQRSLPVIILNDLRDLVLYQTHPILVRVLVLKIIVRRIPYNLGPFRALVAEGTRPWNGVHSMVGVFWIPVLLRRLFLVLRVASQRVHWRHEVILVLEMLILYEGLRAMT